MLTSIVILTLNNLNQTVQCLHSIRTYTDSPYELIFVDNGSTDGTIPWLLEQPDIRLIANGTNVGFACACNQGAAAAKGDHILLLNNDTLVSHRWLSVMLECLHASDRIGIVGPMSNYVLPMQRIPTVVNSAEHYHSLAQDFNIHNPAKWQDITALSGFCMLLRRSTWSYLGGFDETFGIGGYEDIDLCYRVLRAGLILRLAGDVLIYHEGNRSFTTNAIDMYEVAGLNRRLFIRKWGFNPERLILRLDPAFLPDRYITPHPHHAPRALEIPSGWFAMGDDDSVYRIERGYKRLINSYETFRQMNLNLDRVGRPGPQFLHDLPIGVPIDAANFPQGYPDVFLARDPDGGLFSVEYGIRYPIRDEASLHSLGLRIEEAIPVNFMMIFSLPEGWPLQENVWEEHELYDYKLYRGPDHRLYYSEGQRLRLILQEEAINRYGWNKSRAISILKQLFERIPHGYAIR